MDPYSTTSKMECQQGFERCSGVLKNMEIAPNRSLSTEEILDTSFAPNHFLPFAPASTMGKLVESSLKKKTTTTTTRWAPTSYK